MHVRPSLLAGILALVLSSSSCLGPDNAYRSVKQWNAGLSQHDWVEEVVFIAFFVVPVYPVALLADLLVFNTIDYWGGDNLINDPGAFEGFPSDGD